jgi:hypothetical protein
MKNAAKPMATTNASGEGMAIREGNLVSASAS